MLDRELALYRGLQARGIDTGFVTYGDKRDLNLAYTKSLASFDINCNLFRLPKSWYQHGLQLFPPRGDIFKSNQVAGSAVAMKAARRARAKFIARCGYLLSEFEERRHGMESDRARDARRLEKNVFQNADRVVVTTPAIADLVHHKYGIEKGKLRVIPNYVETNRFKPRRKNKNKTLRIISVGRLEAQKNIGLLISAVAPLEVEVLVVGNGSQRPELENASQKAKARVRFLGNLPSQQLPELLNSCDLFVLPSHYEGHPKALLEAMACGLPVVGTRVPGIQGLIREDENGLLCETNSRSLRSAITRALDNPELRSKLGRSARRFVEQNFSLDRVLEMELSIIKELTVG